MAETRKGGARPGAGRKPAAVKSVVVRMPLDVVTLAKRIAEGVYEAGDVQRFVQLEPSPSPRLIPLMTSLADCGFPSPADDHLDRPISFDELFKVNPQATFAVYVKGNSMIEAGIFPGDLAVVDRARTAKTGDVIVAVLDREFTIKRFKRTTTGITLVPANKEMADITVTEAHDFEVWGVVKYTVRKHS